MFVDVVVEIRPVVLFVVPNASVADAPVSVVLQYAKRPMIHTNPVTVKTVTGVPLTPYVTPSKTTVAMDALSSRLKRLNPGIENSEADYAAAPVKNT